MLIQVLWEVALEMDGPSIAVRGTLVDLLSSLLKCDFASSPPCSKIGL